MSAKDWIKRIGLWVAVAVCLTAADADGKAGAGPTCAILLVGYYVCKRLGEIRDAINSKT